ncbi:SUMF1/EgtB/PvdO family nonheme iron enzyme, partial [Prosthecobacter sp.]|uniref:formylglycine-generating enzyme family protein n=1 Tax=Prosthecobacter sp. TaxID=1965333 RepID=UPI001D748F19
LPALAAVADPAPQRLKELRDIFVREVAKIESTLIAGLDQSLATVQASLVQAGKTAEAGSVEKYRTQMMAAFKTGAPTAVAPTPSSVTTTNPAEATKDRPFVNALGMKFVPVPGTKVLMCIHETRRRDFAAFDDARPTGNSEWRIPFPLEGESRETDQHPVIKVSWLESVAFADWLTEREGVRYRLPTDDEWSKAVGGDEFPWGNQWPPTSAIGNYADDSTIGRIKGDYGSIPGYTDGFILTAPVMSFPANNLGIHDLGGNVWEWCETPSPQKPTEKILRGAAWNRGWRNHLASSMRTEQPPGDRFNVYGFRVVIELPATAAQPTSSVSVPAPKPVTSSPTLPVSSSPSTATKDKPFVNSLGMKFVPIRITGGPTDGKTLLFSVWETRVKDFAEFAKANSVSDAAWQNLSAGGVTQTGDHPVVNVSWDDAVRFCKWLSKKENVVCRLPSDHEWSCAAGIGATEDPRLSPAAKSPRGVGAYPWGTAKNPPNDFANYKGMNDGFAFTAPVGSFSATADGLHDLWGNAGEWCDDWHDPAIRAQRVIRGHSWENFGPPRTVNWRLTMPRDGDASMVGFRVVIELP